MGRALRSLPLVQGVYYLATGVWPLLHLESFLTVTGPKEDIWLLKGFSLLLIAISISLIIAWFMKNVNLPVIVLGAATALFVAGVDFYYPIRDRIRDIYMLDGIVEIFIVLLWSIYLYRYGKIMNKE